MAGITDRFDRPLRSLRLSVTDRCNLRCQYCMPEQDYVWLPHADLLTFEELDRLVGVFAHLGVDKVRITGGEPLLRRDLDRLVALLARRPQLTDLALTTNGVLLQQHAATLRAAGLHRVTVSLDTLDAATYQLLARRDALAATLAGIDAALAAGFTEVKLDTVVIAGVNDGEIPALVRFGRDRGVEVRFIEYMDVGGATHWRLDRVVGRDAILRAVATALGPVEPVARTDWAPADRYRLQDGTVFGVIASVTAPFCRTCDRSRVTADGMFFRCLYAQDGLDLRAPLRSGKDDASIAALIAAAWRERTDRGAEVRLDLPDRGALAPKTHLQGNPHLEMHTRGG